MKRVAFLLFIVALNGFQLSGQVELQKVAPLSPNAAAITKYGEIPVGHFTGVPNISIPVYTIQSRSLSLPLALSYHAGGIKVEEIASWVGLGWSLNSIPSISRKVCGKADELAGGYFGEYYGLTIEEIHDSASLYGDGYWMESFHRTIFDGEADTEADIYYFTLATKSGKFWWNQRLQKFQTQTWSNISIEYNILSGVFTITDEDGTIYRFGSYETSQSSGGTAGPILKSSWFVDKMYDANKTDSISFNYSAEITYTTTINTNKKVIFGSCSSASVLNSTTVSALLPSSIYFSKGSVIFTKSDSGRQDLNGGHALDNIRVYNTAGQLIHRFNFNYHYRTSSVSDGTCLGASSYDNKRLFLDDFISADTANVTIERHQFLYDSAIAGPCRVSAAQDYWGYYNGQNYNPDLIPATARILPNGYQQISGANRNVNPSYSQLGILKRIYFPTGGYNDFTYENNTAGNNDDLPYEYQTRIAYLEGEAPNPITTNTYIDTFTVNNAADNYLNSNLGGGFLSAVIGDYGCDLSGGSDPCAVFTIRGIDAGNSGYSATVLPNNIQNWYVPNGNYEIKAVFSQTPALYDGFYFIVSWLAFDSAQQSLAYNRHIGGLRIGSITSYDNAGLGFIRKYQYTTALATDTSSGDIFGVPYFIADDNTYTSFNNSLCYAISGEPNAISVTHSGSYIGYKRVFELYDSAGNNGMTEYNFTHEKDIIFLGSPYPPPVSKEYFRGLPSSIVVYQKKAGSLYPVSRNTFEYLYKSFDSLKSVSYKVRIVRPPLYEPNDIFGIWDGSFYNNIPGWSGILTKTEKIYQQTDTTKYSETITSYKYNNLYQSSENKFVNSKGDTIKTKDYYPQDITLTGAAETARQALVTQNNISAVLKREQYKNSTLTNEVKTNYKQFGTIVKPEEIFQKIGSGSSLSRIRFLKYMSNGNLVSQQKTNDVVISYLYDYSSTLPVAEIINADSASVAYTSFEADGKGGWSFSGSASVHPTAVTGSKGYSLAGGNITKSGLTSGTTYVVTYWKKDSSSTVTVNSGSGTDVITLNGWKLIRHEVTGTTSLTISGTAYIDELRLYPKGAQMTTYTHLPLAGVSSQCDANNRITYYEYDSFNRLKLVRDQNKNILNVIDYKYQQNQNQ